MKLTRTFPNVIACLALTVPVYAQNTPSGQVKAITSNKPTLEMVFVLDTTGSMGGLIEGAKQRIWDIVNDVLKVPSHPKVRIGLVAYRDNRDAYVTKVLPLTSDLDKVYSTLMDYRAEGGDDTPENVRRALADGVHKAGWSSRAQKRAQILFLVGDAPPHDDYSSEPDTAKTTGEAIRQGIIVNTIQCGNLDGTREAWQEIARRGEGQYFAIAQDGGVQTIATPYDRRLSELGAKLGGTYMAYGGGGGMAGSGFRAGRERRQAEVEAKVMGGAPAMAGAGRAVNKALNTEAYAGDLLQSIENGTVKLESVKTEDLPDSLQKIAPATRKKEVERRLGERKQIRVQIVDLSRKRDAYLAAHRQRPVSGKQAAFDAAVSSALKKQMARRGVK